MKTSEVLDLAADAIQERGWTQAGLIGESPWGREGGPVCLEGGILAAMDDESMWCRTAPKDSVFETCPAYNAVAEYLGGWYVEQADDTEGTYRPTRLYNYNDAKGRTAEDVIAVLRAAAAVERVKEESLEGAEVTA